MGGKRMKKDLGVKRATLSVMEVANIMGVSKNVAYEAARRGEIPSIRLGGRILVPRAALEQLLETGNHDKPDSRNT